MLLAWGEGDESARERLLAAVYDELRRLALAHMRREQANHTLQPTALVNEAYLKLVRQEDVRWQGRAHFFGIAARLMREILVDHARRRTAEKRGGAEQQRLSLTAAGRGAAAEEVDTLALHEAIERLARLDPEQARVVELRFFGGLNIEDTAEVLGVSHATVERKWKLARAWLRRELTK